MATKVPEQSTCWITVSFFGKDGTPATPTSATWQIIDVDSGTVMQAEGSMAAAQSVELQVPPEANEILDDTLSEETRRLIIKSVYGADDEYNKSYDYIVENLSVIT